jgi:hypothetical protein
MAGNDDSSTGIANACGFVPIPAFQVAVNQPAGERISRAQDVVDFDRESGDIEWLLTFLKNCCAFRAAFDDQSRGAKGEDALYGCFQISGDFWGGDLGMFDFQLYRVGEHRGEDFFFRSNGDIYIPQDGAGVDSESAHIVPLVGSEVNVEENRCAALFRPFNG